MHHSQLSFPTLRFQKKASEIKTALQSRRKVISEKQEALRKEVTDICMRWDLKPDEVYAAGANETAISTYSNKMGSNLGFNSNSPKAPAVNQTVLAQLQSDNARLPYLGRKHYERVQVLLDLERVEKNLGEDGRLFDLTYPELATLGF